MAVQAVPNSGKHIPKVTVIIPLFNVENVIAETLDSLFKQSMNDVEYLLIDDGSTDRTLECACQFTAGHASFTVLHQENAGPSSARNHGLRLATGRFVTFMDADDRLPADALQRLYEAAVAYEADLVIGETLRWDGKRAWRIPEYVAHGVTVPGLKLITTHPGLLYAMGPCAKLFRRELLEGLYFPEHLRLGEDQPFVLQAYLRAKRIYTVDAVVYYYRVSPTDKPSLTLRALQDPAAGLRSLYGMLLLTDELLQSHPALYRAYLHRVVVCDILPRLRAALCLPDDTIQVVALQEMVTWLHSVNKPVFNAVSGLYAYLPLNLLYCQRTVRQAAKPGFRKLIATIHQKLNAKGYLLALPTMAAVVTRRILPSRRQLSDAESTRT